MRKITVSDIIKSSQNSDYRDIWNNSQDRNSQTLTFSQRNSQEGNNRARNNSQEGSRESSQLISQITAFPHSASSQEQQTELGTLNFSMLMHVNSKILSLLEDVKKQVIPTKFLQKLCMII